MYNSKTDSPCYVISIAARLVEMHPQTLRYYERLGLIQPSRSRGKIRLYSDRDVERLRYIKRLINDLGVNLAGVEVIMNLMEKMVQMERDLEELQQELEERLEDAPRGHVRRVAIEQAKESDST